jgi:hypothetical protein
MDPDDLVVEAFGVLLTQVRTARRALEDVQRNTSRYMGFEFAKALAEGPAFGQPPMFGGGLMVHIVNINDLAPGNSFGGFLEALFGGIGNFFSNMIGGTVGSFLTAFALPKMVERLDNIVSNIRQIIERLGVGQGGTESESAEESGASTPQAQATTGSTLATTLDGIRGTVRDVTALFQAASSGPGDTSGANAAGETSSLPLTRTGERWMAIIEGVNRLLDRTAHIVDALILLIPNVIGALALLIANLAGIRRALLETIQFMLRNALILRGVLLTVIFETVASAARLAAAIVTILGTTIQSILTAIIGVIQALLGAAFDALETLTNALQAIVRSLLQWLVTGVFDTLRAIGELSVFRTIDHLVRILPALLPPIFMLMNQGNTLPTDVMTMLQDAHAAAFPSGSGTGSGSTGGSGTGSGSTSVTIGDFPDIDTILQPLEATLSTAVDATAAHLQGAAETTFGEASGALTGLAGRFDGAVRAEADFSRGILRDHVDRIREQAGALAGTITAPLEAEGPETGLEEIAQAYQDWLTGGGMNALMDRIAPHFAERPAEGEPGGPLRLLRGEFDRPRASIDIDQVEIVVEAPAEAEEGGPAPGIECQSSCLSDEDIYRAVVRYAVDLEERGIRSPDPYDAIA